MEVSPEQLTGVLALAFVLGFCIVRQLVISRRKFFDARRAETRAARSAARAHLARVRPTRVPPRRESSGARAAAFHASHRVGERK